MISIIICSINQELCNKLRYNIELYIGVEYEMILFDNTDKKWGITKVYNYCALKAKFKYLCFIHEDILINTTDWGQILIDYYIKTENCGIIGFAGGSYAPKNTLSWIGYISECYYNFWEYDKLSNDYIHHIQNPKNSCFSEVVLLDGLFLFMRKDIYENIKFDEHLIKGFHLYDLDISLNSSFKYKNFVCNTINIYHLSPGVVSKSYCYSLLEFQKKWNDYLPASKKHYSSFKWFLKGCTCAYGTYLLCIKNNISHIKVLKHILLINDIFTFIIVLFYIPIGYIRNFFLKNKFSLNTSNNEK